MSGIVDTNPTINFNDGTFNFTGGNTDGPGLCPMGSSLAGHLLPDGSDDLLLTPVGAGTQSMETRIRLVSAVAVTGLFIGTGEGIRLDYVHDLTGNPAGSGGSTFPPIATLSLRTTMR